MTVQNWSGPAEIVQIGYSDWSEYPRVHSSDDLRAVTLAEQATNSRSASLPTVDLRRASRPTIKTTKARKPMPVRALVRAAVIVCFIAIVAAQVAENYRPAFRPYSVPISVIRSPYACGLGDQITAVTLEAPGTNGSPSVYEIHCASGEQLAVFER